MFATISSRPLLFVAYLVVLLHLTFTVDSTTAQTTAGTTDTAAATNAPTTVPVVTVVPAANRTNIRYEVVMVHEGIAVWASLLMTTILIADACQSYGVVKNVACFGPFGCMLLAGAVMLLAYLPAYNNGNNNQEGFTGVMVQAPIAAALAFFAAFAGFSSRNYIGDGSKRGFPYGTMSLLCSVGLMPAIGGTCFSAFNVAEGYQWPGIILGSVCCGEMLILIIWYLTYAVTKKGSSGIVDEESELVRMPKN